MTAGPSLMSDAEAQEALRRIVFQMSDAEANRLRSEIVWLGQYLRAVACRSTPPLPAGFVAVPRELAERVAGALGRFVGDEGWRGADMGTADDFAALLTASPPPPAVPVAEGREALHPECSICRRRHGHEVIHECE